MVGIQAQSMWGRSYGVVVFHHVGSCGVRSILVTAFFNWTRLDRVNHIFRNAFGHVNPSSEGLKRAYAKLYEAVANNPSSFRPDLRGPDWLVNAGGKVYTQVVNGYQVWVYVLPNGEIADAGLNWPGFFR